MSGKSVEKPAAGRPKSLDEAFTRSNLLAMLSTGLSRRVACKYVGVHRNTLAREMERNAEFRAEVEKAEARHETTLLMNIGKAGRNEKLWRAAAWELERKYPERYRARSPDAILFSEFRLVFRTFGRAMLRILPEGEGREEVIDWLEQLPAVVQRRSKKRPPRKAFRDTAGLAAEVESRMAREPREAEGEVGDGP